MTTAAPVVLLLGGTGALGLYMGKLYLQGQRKPMLIGAHLLLGVLGLETLVMAMRGTPAGDAIGGGSLGQVAAGFFALSMFSGLLAPLLANHSRRRAEAVLVAHVGVGLAGLLLVLVWVGRM